jgi:hypothetical protein
VTVADFVVVVGVVVVVVVVVLVVWADGEAVVRVALLEVEDEEPLREVAVVTALVVPGCSPATRRPMRAVDAVAATTADCVMRRRRRRAR